METASLVGVWRLVSTRKRNLLTQAEEPWGRYTQGLLVYTPDLYMSSVMSVPGRAPFPDDDPRKVPAETQAKVYSGYMSYFGRFAVEGDSVAHFVEMSLFPNWIGTIQRRNARLSGKTLLLSTQPAEIDGAMRVYELLWHRAEDQPA